MRTGVSNAIHAIILGQRGASLSGRELEMARSASAATRPPILQVTANINEGNLSAERVLTYAHTIQS